MMRKKRAFTVIHGQHKKKRPMKKWGTFLLFAVVAVFILQAGFSFAREKIAIAFVNTVMSGEEVLEKSVAVKGVIIRRENVVAAPVTGTVRWSADEGERLGLGAKVAAITSATGEVQRVVMPAPGVVVLQLDGLEGALQPQSLEQIDVVDILQQASKKLHQVKPDELVQQGTMLFKVVDNFTWYFMADFSQESYQEIKALTNLRLRFSFSPAEDVIGKIVFRQEADERVTVVLEFKDTVTDCLIERFAEAEVVFNRTRGIVLPTSALVLRGEETGIYVLEKSVVRFRAVDVVEASKDKVVVEGVRQGSQVITNPILVREGMRL